MSGPILPMATRGIGRGRSAAYTQIAKEVWAWFYLICAAG